MKTKKLILHVIEQGLDRHHKLVDVSSTHATYDGHKMRRANGTGHYTTPCGGILN